MAYLFEDRGGLGMSGSIGIVNNGMITQNYDAINRFGKAYTGKDLSALSTGTMRAVSAEELKAENERKKSEPRVLNVDSSEIINNVFSKTGNNVTYDIGGVSFSNEEMKACKEVVKNALSFLPTMGSDLDYYDYASMGIASNMVSSYVRDNLTKEQVEIVNKSFETYLNDMVHAEKERHNRDGIYMSNSSLEGINKETNSYYSLRTRNNETGFDPLQNLFNDRMSQNVKDTILQNASHVKEYGSVVQSASNEDAAKSIMDLFKILIWMIKWL